MRRAILLAVLLCSLAIPAAQAGTEDMSYNQLARAGNKAIQKGHVYSSRWGDASPWLRSICYEMIDRAFAPFGTQRWAHYVVNRESGCNPGAINSDSAANGIAQIMPSVWTQYDHYRMRHDLRYAVSVFVRMSNGGRYTRPWGG